MANRKKVIKNITINPIISGPFIIKLLETPEELKKVQELRYKEMLLDYNQQLQNATGLDESPYDAICDHIIAIDTTKDEIIATYRLIRDDHAKEVGSFITESEYNIDSLKKGSHRLLELGRAVIKKEYRAGVILKLIWKFIFDYVSQYEIRFLFGTASYHGLDPQKYDSSLAYLYYNYLIDKEFSIHSHNTHGYRMNSLMPQEIDLDKALSETPTLIKGYLVLGAKVGNGIFIDEEFHSVDVFILLDFQNLNINYVQRLFKDFKEF